MIRPEEARAKILKITVVAICPLTDLHFLKIMSAIHHMTRFE